MLFWKKRWKRKSNRQGSQETDGEESYLVDRGQVNLQDSFERERYVHSLLEQIADASNQIAVCNAEYKTVDFYLKDIEEIEYITREDREKLTEYAKAIDKLEGDKSRYEEKKQKLSDADFAKMEKLADDTDEGVRKLKEAEEYQQAIRSDLQRLESEKQACLFRRQEAAVSMENLRGMAVICTVAVFACLFLLLLMQFAFSMNAQIGYILTAAVAAVALTAIYMKYLEASGERARASRSLNKVILLQNRVKIRYVNNTNLLDYLYLKFGIRSSKELSGLWEKYQVEKEERDKLKEAMKDLTFSQEQLVRLLRIYKLHDPLIWLHQARALYDAKEMVEVRHSLILRRQKLRKQIEFNTENAEKAQNEVKEMVADYPRFAKEILKMLSDYEEKYPSKD